MLNEGSDRGVDFNTGPSKYIHTPFDISIGQLSGIEIRGQNARLHLLESK